jgi:hypothetical protein
MTAPHDHGASSGGTGGTGGTVGEEASRLLDAVHDWARHTFGEGASARMATGAPECEWCPLCQFVAVLRGDRPETTEKIVAAGTAVMSALRALLDQPTADPDEPRPRVQRIDLDES